MVYYQNLVSFKETTLVTAIPFSLSAMNANKRNVDKWKFAVLFTRYTRRYGDEGRGGWGGGWALNKSRNQGLLNNKYC